MSEIPCSFTEKCPKCNMSQQFDWLDAETQKKKIEKELKLNQNPEIESQINQLQNELTALREGRNADRKEIENLRQLIDLTVSNDIKEIKEQYSLQEYDKNFLQNQITALEKTLEEIKQLSLKNRKDLDDER